VAPLRRPRCRIWVLLGILVLATGVRLVGIQLGLPYYREPDEDTKVEPAVRMVVEGHWSPGWLGHPGSTTIYPLSVLYRLYWVVGHGGSLLGANPEMLTTFERDSSPFYLVGRLLSITYAVLTVAMVYYLAQLLLPREPAWSHLLAAGIAAIDPSLVFWSRIARTDTALAFFVTATLVLSLRARSCPLATRVLMAGAAGGLAVGSKYSAAAVLLTLPAALVLARPDGQPLRAQRWVGLSILGALAAVFAFALSTPTFLLDWKLAQEALLTETRTAHLGADGLSVGGNLVYYLSRAFPYWLTWPLYMAGLVGLAKGLAKYGRQWLVVLAFVVPYVVETTLHPLHWDRWIVPTLPMLWVGGALAAVQLSRWIAGRLHREGRGKARQSRTLVAATVVSLLLLWPAGRTARDTIRMATPNTRLSASRWVETHVAAGSRFAVEEYAAPLQQTVFPWVGFGYLAQHPLSYYEQEGFDYLMTSSAMVDRFFREPARYPVEVGFYTELAARLDLVQEISPTGWWQPGPVIRIYQLRSVP